MKEYLVALECDLCEALKHRFIEYKGKRVCLHCWQGFRDDKGKVDFKKLDECIALLEVPSEQ